MRQYWKRWKACHTRWAVKHGCRRRWSIQPNSADSWPLEFQAVTWLNLGWHRIPWTVSCEDLVRTAMVSILSLKLCRPCDLLTWFATIVASMSSADSQHPKKRKTITDHDELRGTPSASSANKGIYLDSEKVWFADGNVILQTSTTRYRVHRTVLAAHSSIFKDMFEVSQPDEQSEMLDACPVIHVSDSTEDWDEFLPLLYHLRRYGISSSTSHNYSFCS